MTDLADMTVKEAYRLLDRVTKRLDRARAREDAILDERAHVFKHLLSAGERQADIARRARVTPMAVSFAVEKRTGPGEPEPVAATG